MPWDNYSPQVVVSTEGLSRDKWLDYRRLGVGGSDVSAIFGVSQFKTARDLYYDKLNIATFDDSDDNLVAKEVGHLLEDLVARIFSKRTGYRIYKIEKMFRHPIHTFMLADVDYFVELPNGKTAILEIKTTNYNAKDCWWIDGNEIVPIYYELQGRHYMCVMNLDEVFYCCLYGNKEDEVICRHLVRDFDYDDEMIALESDFWRGHVLRKIPPEYVEDGELVMESVRRTVGPADTSLPDIVLPNSYVSDIERYMELQREKAVYNSRIRKIEDEMKLLQGRVTSEMGKVCTAGCRRGMDSYEITYNPIRKPTISKENLILLNAQHPEIYRDYVTISESRRFNVKKLSDIPADVSFSEHSV